MRKELIYVMENMKDKQKMKKLIKRQSDDKMHQIQNYMDFLSVDSQKRWNEAIFEAWKIGNKKLQ